MDRLQGRAHGVNRRVMPGRQAAVVFKFPEGDELLLEYRPSAGGRLTSPKLGRVVTIPEGPGAAERVDWPFVELQDRAHTLLGSFNHWWDAERGGAA